MKKLFSLFIALAFLTGIAGVGFAADPVTNNSVVNADQGTKQKEDTTTPKVSTKSKKKAKTKKTNKTKKTKKSKKPKKTSTDTSKSIGN